MKGIHSMPLKDRIASRADYFQRTKKKKENQQ